MAGGEAPEEGTRENLKHQAKGIQQKLLNKPSKKREFQMEKVRHRVGSEEPLENPEYRKNIS